LSFIRLAVSLPDEDDVVEGLARKLVG